MESKVVVFPALIKSCRLLVFVVEDIRPDLFVRGFSWQRPRRGQK